MNDGLAGPDVRFQRGVDPPGGRLAVLADDRQHVLECVYGDDHANQVLREPAPGLSPEIVEQVGVVEVHRVDPHSPGEHDLLLPGVYRREHLVAP